MCIRDSPLCGEQQPALRAADPRAFLWAFLARVIRGSLSQSTGGVGPVSYTHLRAHETSAHL
eukprot:1533617-Alexandrium_andersonii.AAC.1